MKLNIQHRKLLHNPSEEDLNLARRALPEIRASARYSFYLPIILLIAIIFTFVAINNNTVKIFWLFPIAFYVLFASSMLDLCAAKSLAISIERNDFKVLHGKSRGTLNYSKPVAEIYEVHSSIPGSNTSFIFDIDFETVKALPESGWDFMIVANNYYDIVVMESPNNKIFLSRSIHRYYPYAEEI